MIRLLLIIAIAYGAFWCYNTFSNFSKDEAVNSMKNMKIIKTVNDGRAKMNYDAQHAGEFNP